MLSWSPEIAKNPRFWSYFSTEVWKLFKNYVSVPEKSFWHLFLKYGTGAQYLKSYLHDVYDTSYITRVLRWNAGYFW